jgi:nicotinamidase-related amidase
VLTGAESHVCVMQTALDLLALGKEVFVVAEAVGSRRPEDRQLALERMRQEGCRIVSREMVAFEWLHEAGTETFRAVSREFLR